MTDNMLGIGIPHKFVLITHPWRPPRWLPRRAKLAPRGCSLEGGGNSIGRMRRFWRWRCRAWAKHRVVDHIWNACTERQNEREYDHQLFQAQIKQSSLTRHRHHKLNKGEDREEMMLPYMPIAMKSPDSLLGSCISGHSHQWKPYLNNSNQIIKIFDRRGNTYSFGLKAFERPKMLYKMQTAPSLSPNPSRTCTAHPNMGSSLRVSRPGWRCASVAVVERSTHSSGTTTSPVLGERPWLQPPITTSIYNSNQFRIVEKYELLTLLRYSQPRRAQSRVGALRMPMANSRMSCSLSSRRVASRSKPTWT